MRAVADHITFIALYKDIFRLKKQKKVLLQVCMCLYVCVTKFFELSGRFCRYTICKKYLLGSKAECNTNFIVLNNSIYLGFIGLIIIG